MSEIHEFGGENTPLFNADEMVPGTIELRPIRNVSREIAIGAVQDVSHENGTLFRYLVIKTAQEIILRADVWIIDEGLSGAGSCSRCSEKFRRVVRKRVQRHRVSHSLSHTRIYIFRDRRAASAARSDGQELVSAGVWNSDNARHELLFPQT